MSASDSEEVAHGKPKKVDADVDEGGAAVKEVVEARVTPAEERGGCQGGKIKQGEKEKPILAQCTGKIAGE